MERALPAWLWLLAGFVALEGARAAAPPPAPRFELGAEPPARSLARLSPRELRRLPGIGQTRALAYARLRWSSPGTPPLEAVRGIGPVIGAAAARALDGGAPAAPSHAEPPELDEDLEAYP